MKFSRVARTAGMSLAGTLLAASLCGPAAAASSYPSKPIQVIVPFGPGGVTDMLARIVANELTKRVGQSVVIENRTGAGGNIGAAAAARAKPDGYTLLVGAASTNAINPSLFKEMPYDPLTDFSPITNLASVDNLLLAGPQIPEKTIKELVARESEHPYRYASTGAGGTQHLSGELFNVLFGTDLIHVPYKGAGPALQDVIGERVELFFCNLPACLPHVKDGRLHALGITSSERSPLLPEVPTIAEAAGGDSGYVVQGWFGLFAPTGVPEDILDYLNETVVEILNDPEVKESMLAQGAVPQPLSRDEFTAFVKHEHDRWADVVKKANITLE